MTASGMVEVTDKQRKQGAQCQTRELETVVNELRFNMLLKDKRHCGERSS
jgi:hypothetical protein